MKPAEHKIGKDGSDFYIYTPSKTALKTFLYPLRTGHFIYEPGYELERSSFDSYLIMYIKKGSMTVTTDSGNYTARDDDFILLDCYKHHRYCALEESEVNWLHFDGLTAAPYFNFIYDRLGTVFAMQKPGYVLTIMDKINLAIGSGSRISEPLMAKYITDILTEFALHTEAKLSVNHHEPHVVEDILAYIAGHLQDHITVEDLARQAFMSEYHFIRVFKKETGYTPHAYIIDARMHAARYKLVTSDMPLKQLCAESGFSNVSAFCALFKRKFSCTPIEYRERSYMQTRPNQVE